MKKRKSKHVVATSEHWSCTFDTVVSGIAFDKDGLHLAKIWPDADLEYKLVPWALVVPEKASPIFNNCWFQFVDGIYVDVRNLKLTPENRKQMNSMVKALSALPEQFNFRVVLFKGVDRQKGGRVSSAYLCGKARAVRAAKYAFAEKLATLRKLNCTICNQALQTNSSTGSTADAAQL